MSEVTVEAEPLRELAESLLAAAGVPKPHATMVVAALLDADIEGLSSHGLVLLPMYLDRISAGSVSPTAQGRIVALDLPTGTTHVRSVPGSTCCRPSPGAEAVAGFSL